LQHILSASQNIICMNFLAHLYLSGDDEEWRLGGFIADAVKGEKILSYSQGIQKGIILHRKVDYFTDTHPLFKQSVERLKPRYKRYSGVITDMFYDHFLSVYWENFSKTDLSIFAKTFYIELVKNYLILPVKSRIAVPFLVYHNWLLTYSNLEDLKKRFEGMSRRTSFISGMETAVEELEKNYKWYENEFFEVFNDVLNKAEIEKEKLKGN